MFAEGAAGADEEDVAEGGGHRDLPARGVGW